MSKALIMLVGLLAFLGGIVMDRLVIDMQDELPLEMLHDEPAIHPLPPLEAATIKPTDTYPEGFIPPEDQLNTTTIKPIDTYPEGFLPPEDQLDTTTIKPIDTYPEGFIPPEDQLDKPASGWNGHGGGWPTPFHVFFHHYKNIAGPLALKWEPYFIAYHDHLKHLRGKEATLVEIGVQSGGSALMWRWYFGDKFKYVGIDINPETQQFATLDWLEVNIGDTGTTEFWKEFKQKHPSVDMFLDDGGHTMSQMAMAFREYYPNVKPDGVWITEDLHTCFWAEYEGNPNPLSQAKIPNFCEYTKNFIDWINGHRINQDNGAYHKVMDAQLLPFLHSTQSIHYYESIIVLKKGRGLRRPPAIVQAGTYKVVEVSNTPYSGLKYDWSKIDAPPGFLDFLRP